MSDDKQMDPMHAYIMKKIEEGSGGYTARFVVNGAPMEIHGTIRTTDVDGILMIEGVIPARDPNDQRRIIEVATRLPVRSQPRGCQVLCCFEMVAPERDEKKEESRIIRPDIGRPII